MSHELRLKFDPGLDYQLEAIQSVVGVFRGLPRRTSEFALGDAVVPNLPPYETLEESWLYDNVLAVQTKNGISSQGLVQGNLEVDEGMVLEGVGAESWRSWRYPSFTIEMETGTGKTYVYLRTIYELRKHYGFRKFIVVVPSIAIYEGVIKNFQVTQSHLRALYGNEPVDLIQYDGSRLSALRGFAASTFVEIMVMTIDSFNKRVNKIYKASEQLPGEQLPFQYVQETRPILVLDEPQNMKSRLAKEALRTLHPLFALRYSATHVETPNLLYCLTPFEAYRRGVVKRIQVDGVIEADNFNRPFIALRSPIVRQGGTWVAMVRTYVEDKGRTGEADVLLRQGDDLYAKTGREGHQHGYRVTEINAAEQFVEFENGEALRLDDSFGPTKVDIFRTQIDRTVEQHMQLQELLREAGLKVKVLSLFFIDRVAHYKDRDGFIRRLFDEAFERHKGLCERFRGMKAEQVRDGYFAKRKSKGPDGEEAFDSSGRTDAERRAEKDAFELIMRDKEKLLSLEEPVSFIFAHSALKEGWDNPNVFQICTLNQTVSEMKKRQEIGRGLRIPVDQSGERVFDERANVLTVVANESYHNYAASLQSEYAEAGYAAPPPPSRVGRAIATRRDELFGDGQFHAFWEKLQRRAQYRIRVDTPVLIAQCVERLNKQSFPSPRIVVERGTYVVTRFTLVLEAVAPGKATIRVDTENTLGEKMSHTTFYGVGSDLSEIHSDRRLRGLKIQSLIDAGDSPRVMFENDAELSLGEPLTFESEAGQAPRERSVRAPEQSYPVMNLLDRGAKETGLTRKTLNQIFQQMNDSKRAMVLKNPEGFANVFVSEVRTGLADHLVEGMEFTLSPGNAGYELAELFPPSKEFPQRELIEGGENSLYDKIQVDSGVERGFVEKRLNPDGKVICYFKFPPAFRIPFPKIIGQYNPDWGILRYNGDGAVVLELVRETKGTEELDKLQYPRETRKVRSAERYFPAIGIDYRAVNDETVDWWRSSDALPTQPSLGL